MAFYIKPHPASTYQRGYADHNDINQFFGFAPYAKVPREFSATRQLELKDGRMVEAIYYPGAPMRLNQHGRMIKSSRHRVKVRCPDCGDMVPAGRAHQHQCPLDDGAFYWISMRNADGTAYLDVCDSWGSYYERKLFRGNAATRELKRLRRSPDYREGDYGIWQLKATRNEETK